jgi:hypothetical protein
MSLLGINNEYSYAISQQASITTELHLLHITGSSHYEKHLTLPYLKRIKIKVKTAIQSSPSHQTMPNPSPNNQITPTRLSLTSLKSAAQSYKTLTLSLRTKLFQNGGWIPYGPSVRFQGKTIRDRYPRFKPRTPRLSREAAARVVLVGKWLDDAEEKWAPGYCPKCVRFDKCVRYR